MAQYKVIQKSFINGAIVDEGDIIEYDGVASGNLELIPDPNAVPEEVKAK